MSMCGVVQWYLYCCADHTCRIMVYVQCMLLERVSVNILQPRYGLGMCQAVALLLVPDIHLTEKVLQRTLPNTLWFTISILHLHFTKNAMSGTS